MNAPDLAAPGAGAIVFTGPSLPPDQAAATPGIVFRQPVGEGDVFRATRSAPRVIGIIDGVFETRPSVWHKEILWAMEQGIHLVGASSMGALRAAELHRFGMVGIGRIFTAYRDGELTDDDEVAVEHGPKGAGYRPVSDALVNIRASLAAAVEQSVLAPYAADRLLAIGKAIHFKHRTYPALMEAAREQGMPGDGLDRLEAWLETGRVDQKRADAEALLEHVAAVLSGQTVPEAPDFTLNRTSFFARAKARAL